MVWISARRRAYDQTARSFSFNQTHRAGGGEARSAFAPGIWKEPQRPLMICSVVWASPEPHGHQGSGAIFHRCSNSRKRPTHVLRWFSLHHAERISPSFPLWVVEGNEVGPLISSTPRATDIESTVR